MTTNLNGDQVDQLVEQAVTELAHMESKAANSREYLHAHNYRLLRDLLNPILPKERQR